MKEENKLGGVFTFAGTPLTVRRHGYGAMQLAGQDGDKRVWGPPRDIPGAIAVLRVAAATLALPPETIAELDQLATAGARAK